jgi:hypothetical protein
MKVSVPINCHFRAVKGQPFFTWGLLVGHTFTSCLLLTSWSLHSLSLQTRVTWVRRVGMWVKNESEKTKWRLKGCAQKKLLGWGLVHRNRTGAVVRLGHWGQRKSPQNIQVPNGKANWGDYTRDVDVFCTRMSSVSPLAGEQGLLPLETTRCFFEG